MLTIDRFESDFVLCENLDGAIVKLRADQLPDNAREGDVIIQANGKYEIDQNETNNRRKAASAKILSVSANKRRSSLVDMLTKSTSPVSATALAKYFGVSRQIIVGDVALLRASGENILATPRGYVIDRNNFTGLVKTIACHHTSEEQLKNELYLIVDNGGVVLDVIVEHPVYGQLSGMLMISSRFDVDQFIEKMSKNDASPLSTLTGGVHLHTIRCSDQDVWSRICKSLSHAGILFEN